MPAVINASPVIPEGIYLDIPAADYHSAGGVSNSMLKHFKRSPAHLVEAMKETQEPSEEMILGTLAHSKILEPDKPLPKIAVQPETYPAPADCSAVKQKKCQPGDPLPWHNAANYCKAWHENMRNQGFITMTKERYESLDGLVGAIAGSEMAKAALGVKQGVSEVSIFKQFNLGGTVMRRMRLDFVHVGPCLVDIKTTDDARLDSFASRAFDMGYHRQAAYYLDGFNEACQNESFVNALPVDVRPLFTPKTDFVFIAIERTPPYGMCFYQVHPEALGRGRAEYIDLLAKFIECRDANNWPCYPEKIQMLELPKWARKEAA